MSKIYKKWMDTNSVGGAQFQLENNTVLRGRNAANSADISILKIRADNVVEFQVIPQILGTPSLAQDVATVQFVKDYASGIKDVKDAVRAFALTNVPLTGATPLVADGVTMADTNRIGLVSQTTASENGIYVVSITGGTYTLTRSTDADTPSEVTQGMSFGAAEGTTYQAAQALLVTPDPIVLGTTSLTFVIIPNAANLTAGDMLVRSGQNIAVDLAAVSALESTNPGAANGQLRVRISDGAAVKDKTTKISGTNALESLRSKLDTFTIASGDITNGYIDLTQVAADSSITLRVKGAPPQLETDDYTVNYTGGASGKTRITFVGDLTTNLAVSDKIQVLYQYL